MRQLLANDDPADSEHITAVTQLWCEIFDNEETWLTTSVCVTCLAILWLAIKGEGVSSMVATTLDAAAGLRRTQVEEAYARATVALTRARKMCVIFCPLDMKGLIGAATVVGSLMYGAGHCWHGTINTGEAPCRVTGFCGKK